MDKPLTLFGITSWWWRPLAGIGAVSACIATIFTDVPKAVMRPFVVIALWVLEWLLRTTPRQPLSIVLTDDTIRVGDRTIAWSELTGLGVGDNGQLELLHGQVAQAKIDPRRVENYEQLVRTILRRVTFDSTRLGDPRTVSIDRGPVVLALLAPVVLLLIFDAPYNVWLASAFWLYLGVRVLRNRHRIDFDDDGLRLRSLVQGTRFIPRADIRSIRLAVSPSGGIWPMLSVHQGGEVSVAMMTVDPLEIFARARGAYPNLVA